MRKSPKVSVLIPTYNYGKFLPEAIRSVLSQRFSDFEMIVVDDASADDTRESVAPFVRGDGRVRFHRHPRNLGMVPNWNWCLRAARGDYVKYLFADDRLESPDALGRMVSMLDGEPRAVLAATARVVLDSESAARDVWDGFGRSGRFAGAEAAIRCLRRDLNLIGEPSAVLFRREAAARGFDPAFRQLPDLEMWFSLLRGGDLVYEKEPLCAFRRHDRQQTAVNGPSRIGVVEGVILRARFVDLFARAQGVAVGSWAMKRRLFQLAYYATKDQPAASRQAGLRPAVAGLLPPRTYLACWMAHRCSRPFFNLRRHLEKSAPAGGRLRPAQRTLRVPSDGAQRAPSTVA